MKGTLSALEARYKAALQDYLDGAGETALQQAYELGRNALNEGLGVLEVAALHHEAMLELLGRSHTPEAGARALRAAGAFFAESLSPFEMTHRGFREANVALRRLNEVLEEEAKRIAHALHDEAGQLLASVHIALGEVARDLPPASRERLSQVRRLLDEIEEDLRRLSHELRPTVLDDLGLVPALRFLAAGVSARSGISIGVDSSMSERLPAVVETTLYRVVQEALTNVAKHARASQVTVRLERTDQVIRCAVRDDGVGFNVPAVFGKNANHGLGLIGMRERVNALGGTVVINSQPSQGTELILSIPVPKEA